MGVLFGKVVQREQMNLRHARMRHSRRNESKKLTSEETNVRKCKTWLRWIIPKKLYDTRAHGGEIVQQQQTRCVKLTRAIDSKHGFPCSGWYISSLRGAVFHIHLCCLDMHELLLAPLSIKTRLAAPRLGCLQMVSKREERAGEGTRRGMMRGM